MVLIYIRLINKRWHQPESPEVPPESTSQKPEIDMKQADNTNFRQAKNARYIRNIQEVYYLERRVFL
jgi:hypothetical protein